MPCLLLIFLLFFGTADAAELPYCPEEELMQSIQVVEGAWAESSADLSTGTIELKRLFFPTERALPQFAYGWSLQIPPSEEIKKEFDAKGRLTRLFLEGKKEEVSITYGENTITATSSLGDSVRYALVHFDQRGYVVETVEKEGFPSIHYRYTPHPLHKKPLMVERRIEGGEALQFAYWSTMEEGCKNPQNSLRLGKLKSVKRNGVLLLSLEYQKGLAIVKYPSGVRLHYRFNENKEIASIETLLPTAQGHISYRTQTFEWQEGKMAAKSLLAADGTLLIREETDQNCERVIGKLTSEEASSDESCTTRYLYNGKGLLREKIEEGGKRIRYLYGPNSPFPRARLIMEENRILLRHLYSYTADGNLQEELIDDLNSPNPDDLSPPSRRLFIAYSSYNLFGKPEEIESGYVDLTSGEKIATEKRCCRYNARGQLISEESFDQNSELKIGKKWEYDAFGKLLYALDGSLQIEYEYDSNGHLLLERKIAPDEQEVKLFAPGKRIVKQETSRQNRALHTLHYHYDESLRLKAIVDELGNTTRYSYDALGRKVKESLPETASGTAAIRYRYDEMDRIVSIRDPLGYETKTSYNCLGRPLVIQHPDGTNERFTYAPDGKLRSHQTAQGITELFARDLFDRVVKEEHLDSNGGVLHSTLNSYSSFDLIEKRTHGDETLLFSYDYQGRLIEQSSTRHAVKTEYLYATRGGIKRDWYGNFYVDSQTDETGKRLQLFSDRGTLLLEQPEPIQSEKIFVETIGTGPDGRPALIVEVFGEQGSHKRTLDPLGRVVEELFCDLAGNRVKEVRYAYDLAGNRVLEESEERKIEWEYGPKNRLEALIENGSRTSYLYNSYGQLETIVKPDGVSLEQRYDAAGRLSNFFSSDGTVSYSISYTKKGQIASVDNLLSGETTSRKHAATGELLSETLDNGLSLSSSYDEIGRRRAILFRDGSSVGYSYKGLFLDKVMRFDSKGKELYSHTYTEYNTLGQPVLEAMIGRAGVLKHTFDPQGRTTGLISPCYEQSARYDSNGNLVELATKDNEGEESESFSYDALDRLILASSSKIETEYDLNGNLVRKTEEKECCRFAYDALNRLVKAWKNEDLVFEAFYDAFHRRICTKEKGILYKHLYDGNFHIGTFKEDGSPLELRILGRSKSSETDSTIAIETERSVYAPVHDVRGSIASLVDAFTGEAFSTRYSPFGKMLSPESLPTLFGFAGKIADAATGLVYFGRRYYDPELKSWTSKDPLGFIDGSDRRQFAKGNPFRYKDAYGLFSMEDIFNGIKADLFQLFKEGANTLLESLRKTRDYTNMGLNQILNHLIGNGFLLLLGYYKTEADKGVYGKGEVSDKVRVSFINGILTDYTSLYSSLQGISSSHGNVSVHYIYRPTKGWVWDILHSFLVKVGYTSPYAEELAKEWRKMIYEMGGVNGGGTIIHYAHSIGTVESLRALSLLTPEEQKMIKMYAFGSPDLSSDGGLADVHHFISVRDGVPLLDPIGFVKAWFNDPDHILFVGTFIGIPLVDHLFSAQCYQDIWKSMGRTFVEWYGAML